MKYKKATGPRFLNVRFSRIVGLLTLALSAAACGRSSIGRTADKLAAKSAETLGCQENFRDKFYDGLYDIVQAHETFASPEQMHSVLAKAFSDARLNSLRAEDRERILSAVTELYTLLTRDAVTKLASPPSDEHQVLAAISAMEMLDTSTPERAELVAKVKTKFVEIAELTKAAGGDQLGACDKAVAQTEVEQLPEADTLLGDLLAKKHPIVYGAFKGLAVAYQSCEPALQPALTPHTPDIRGVKITGNWPHSPGRKREISDLRELISSHPYLSSYHRPKSSCFNVLKSPLIYDYGGKPSTTTGSDGVLDFFTDNGGTKVLGIDCSGYVFSSIATAGLRLTKGLKMKPVFVENTNAAKYMDPKGSGLSCFSKVGFDTTTTIRPGDILASSGHVLIIESVGPDPFGVAHFTSERECTKANMSTERFDFRILQSASTKGGIGINRIQAIKFIDEEPAMATALLEYAVAACKAKVRAAHVQAQPQTASLVRHLGTPECLDRHIKLAREECVDACPAH